MNLQRKRSIVAVLQFLTETAIFVGVTLLMKVSLQDTVLLAAIYFLIMVFYSHYQYAPILIWKEIIQMIKAHSMYWMLAVIIGIYMKDYKIIRISILVGVMFCTTIILGRWFRRRTAKYCANQLLIFGAGRGAERMNRMFGANSFLYVNPCAYVDLEFMTGEKPSTREQIQERIIQWDDVSELLDKKIIDQVFVVDDKVSIEQLEEINNLVQHRVPVVKYRPQIKMVQPYNTRIEDFDGTLFVSIADARVKYLDSVLKRCIDILAGIAGCIVLIPLTIFVKIASMLQGDFDKIIFKQERIGKNGNKIIIYKYRSMVPDAEQLLEEMMEKDPKIREEYLKNKKLDPDPRVTPFGDFLRRTSLDEMPQFINVIKGEMSFIGPRPYLPREVPDMGKDYWTIIKSKPGITGMWQANGRNDVDFANRCKLDVYYYDNWSIWLDIIIVIKTIKKVLYREGAV